jgi:hypothetical protein
MACDEMFVWLGRLFKLRWQLLRQLGIAAAVVSLLLVSFPLLIYLAVEAVFVVVQFHERLPDVPAQRLQPCIPRPLLSRGPLAGRVESGEAPDVSGRRALFDVNVGYEDCGNDPADAEDAAGLLADRLWRAVAVERGV